MILPTNCKALRNVEDNFFYNGIKISKENFDIKEFALICKKINDIKEQIYQEKPLDNIRYDSQVISKVPLYSNVNLLCNINKNSIYFGLYNTITKEIIPLNKKLFSSFTSDLIYKISDELNKTAKMIQKGIIKETKIKDSLKLISFENYIQNISTLSNSFQFTYELEFINGYKDYLLTNEELKNAIGKEMEEI